MQVSVFDILFTIFLLLDSRIPLTRFKGQYISFKVHFQRPILVSSSKPERNLALIGACT